ncbi:MAG TPA: hypothetical protein PKE64_04270 [Anaerolineae bacterium]|nr:hypothetical protein [Anaerolineae bacterium]HMR63208.1 hypothetical protein [Anaerolineae bacterium]
MHNKLSKLRPVAGGLIVLLLATLLLAGCGGAGAPAATESAPAQESPTTEAGAAEPPASPEAETAAETAEPTSPPTAEAETDPTESEVVASGPASCQADDLGLVENEAIPAPSEDDWALGPETATVTIIEYGDFQ